MRCRRESALLTISSGARMPNCTRFTRRIVAFESFVAIAGLWRRCFSGAPPYSTRRAPARFVVVVAFAAAARRPSTRTKARTYSHSAHTHTPMIARERARRREEEGRRRRRRRRSADGNFPHRILLPTLDRKTHINSVPVGCPTAGGAICDRNRSVYHWSGWRIPVRTSGSDLRSLLGRARRKSKMTALTRKTRTTAANGRRWTAVHSVSSHRCHCASVALHARVFAAV